MFQRWNRQWKNMNNKYRNTQKNDNEQEQNQANHVAIISINGTVNRVPEGWGRRHKSADPYALRFLRCFFFSLLLS